MALLDARKSGSFKINDDIEIHRLGFGAMRITGPRGWGPPLDMAEAIRTLKHLPELGIDFIDTAERAICLRAVALRDAPPVRRHSRRHQGWVEATRSWGLGKDGRPEHLREQAIKSRDRLWLEQIGLWSL